ncbi:Nucleoside diphosphate kinase B [Exaiptasia diaphana]|nr:Nucleoside diphosphate kinase B [Exaiptasia diaphana]
MSFPSRIACQLRSSAPLVRNGVIRRAFTTQNSSKGPSMFGNAAPFLLGAASAVTTLMGAKYYYDNKEKLVIFKPVHAASRVVNKGERTFIMVKPDGVQRGLVGEIIKRFEQKGFKLVAMKFVHPSEEHLKKHYADLSKLPFFPGLVRFMSSGPVVAMVWEGVGVVKTGRVMLGETNPADSKPGTIRGDFCVHIGRNIIHGSDSVESADKEINLWFDKKELIDWSPNSYKYVYED